VWGSTKPGNTTLPAAERVTAGWQAAVTSARGPTATITPSASATAASSIRGTSVSGPRQGPAVSGQDMVTN